MKKIGFELKAGQTLGLVGESGSGKSTTGKAVLGLIPFDGSVRIAGREVFPSSPSIMLPIRRSAQMIFQDPYASLDPRMSVGGGYRRTAGHPRHRQCVRTQGSGGRPVETRRSPAGSGRPLSA